MLYVIMPTAKARSALIAHLSERNIQGIFHYVPLHSAPMSKQLGFDDVDLPITNAMSARLIRLPCFFDLETEEQNRTIEAIEAFVS